jgi:hypothetical protein
VSKYYHIAFFCLINLFVSAKTDTDSLPYKLFKDNFILRSSIGYNTAPFQIRGNFGGKTEVLKYRANMSAVKGFGFSYKWISLGVNFTLPGYLRDKSKFGETNYFDLDFSFEHKNWFFFTDFHLYNGFSLINAARFSADLTDGNSNNQIRPETGSASFGLHAYRFKNRNFSMKPAIGVLGFFTEEIQSFYMKYSLNIHGVGDDAGYLMPWQHLNDPRSITMSEGFSALDIGIVPGYVYYNNINNWQFGGLAGLGLVSQMKFYTAEKNTRGFIGLAPRIDLRLQGGYNTERWFAMIDLSFDNKSIRFNDIIYRQNYYYVRLSYGYRFKKKQKK